MTSPQVYFGNLRKAGWVKAPDVGIAAGSIGSIENIGFASGGGFVAVSPGTHRKFNFSWSVGQIDEFQYLWNYRNGLYGTGLLYWVDPYASYYNALPPHWAAPFLTCVGWPSLVGAQSNPSQVAATSALFNQPIYSAQYTISTPPNTVPDRQLVLLIPPTMQLNIGFSGTASGGAVVRVLPVNVDGSLAAVQDFTLLAAGSSTRTNKVFSGATYSAVRIYITSTISGSAILKLDSGDANYSLIGAAYTGTNHNEGRGHTGMRFASEITQAYSFFDDTGITPRRYVSAACDFEEIGGWM